MKKLISFFSFLCLTLVVITYQYYAHWRSEQQAHTSVPYIPADAALVYGVADVGQQWKKLQQTPIGQELCALPPMATLREMVTELEQMLLGNRQDLVKIPLTISVHKAPNEPIEYILYLNKHDIPTQKFLKTAITKVKKNKAYSISVSKYANTNITLLSKKGTSCQLAYIQCGNHVIASFSISSLKRIINTISRKQAAQFLSLKKAKNSRTLYVNLKHLSEVIAPLLNTAQADALRSRLVHFAQYGQLNYELTSHHLLLNGVVQAPANPQYLTNTLVGQKADKLRSAAYLPNSVASMNHVTFSDSKRFLSAWRHYRGKKVTQGDTLTLFNASISRLLACEMSHCIMPGKQGHSSEEELVLLRVKDRDTFIKMLDGAQLLTPATFSATKLPHDVYRLRPACLKETLLGELFPDFDAVYLTHIDNYILLANREGALKSWHNHYKQATTWSQDPTKNSWLDSTLTQAHLTGFWDLSLAWRSLLKAMKPQWQKVFSNYTPPPINISWQLLRSTDHNYHISVLAQHKAVSFSQTVAVPTTKHPKLTTIAEAAPGARLFQADAPLIHAPWLVKSHLGKGDYILLQDANYQLYLLSPAGKLLWKKRLDGPVATRVFQVDFYGSKKIQYLFATERKLYLLDYYGRHVGAYPHALPAPAQLQVIDYEQDHNYRFLLATTQGDIYLKDKYYNTLPGWSPKKLEGPLTNVPFHLRTHGKDYFLTLKANGMLYALKRKGTNYPNFPINPATHMLNPLVVRKVNSQTALTIIDNQGEVTNISMAGQLYAKGQLDRMPSTQRFIVCPSQSTSPSQFAIARQDAEKVAILDSSMKPIFEVPYTKKSLSVQYCYLGKGQQYYILRNPAEDVNYLFDAQGNELALHALKSHYDVQLIYSSATKQLSIYRCLGKELIKHVLDR